MDNDEFLATEESKYNSLFESVHSNHIDLLQPNFDLFDGLDNYKSFGGAT